MAQKILAFLSFQITQN